MPTLTGRVIFQYFYDIGGEIDLTRIPVRKLRLIERPRRYEHVLMPKYEEVGLRPIEVDLGKRRANGYSVQLEGRIFPIGVIGIRAIVEFERAKLDEVIRLVVLNEGKIRIDGREMDFDDLPAHLFDELRGVIRPAIVYPYTPFEYPEIYTTIVIDKTSPELRAQDFLTRFRKQAAGLLRGEKDWRELSEREVDDALKAYLTYSDWDLIAVDWYSTLIYGAAEYTEELTHIVELAKIQLLELKAYDKLLDRRVERAYGSLRSVFAAPKISAAWRGGHYGEVVRAASELAELRVEVTDLVEDMRNILKFTGEWYLGKLYRTASERFRISDWLALVDKKLDRLQELYAMAMERVDVHRATMLEFLVVLLIFVIVIQGFLYFFL
jgi:hypothetical protein